MPSYWWECGQCGSRASFLEASATKAIAHFIWDRLLPSGWDQSYLTLKCQGCGLSSVRITYDLSGRSGSRFCTWRGTSPYSTSIASGTQGQPPHLGPPRSESAEKINYGAGQAACLSGL